ncbi:hypothetical protein K435DRAFT_811511 [Dendrothele bispora CBS 962.96]|uniref:BTB domain-containing protein n=1 Tax=Dendrothele bispora (strain CBS 962.96) TaxID=1314807 RepID=A0A4S8KRR8_DENBC|nr:hypothetical protein K435DRAFT_811511 [Dendrothele bispora CBS 962.96]
MVEIPQKSFIKDLHNSTQIYWDQADLADCTIVTHGLNFRAPPRFSSSNRSVSEPPLNSSYPSISFKVHSRHLIAKSALFRDFFAGLSTVDLLNTTASSGAIQLPRVLPDSTPFHFIISLPVPDPSSIHLLIDWIYSDKTEGIESALKERSVAWDALARNAEYLQLTSDMTLLLHKCWAAANEGLENDPGKNVCDEGSEQLRRGRSRKIKILIHNLGTGE